MDCLYGNDTLFPTETLTNTVNHTNEEEEMFIVTQGYKTRKGTLVALSKTYTKLNLLKNTYYKLTAVHVYSEACPIWSLLLGKHA